MSTTKTREKPSLVEERTSEKDRATEFTATEESSPAPETTEEVIVVKRWDDSDSKFEAASGNAPLRYFAVAILSLAIGYFSAKWTTGDSAATVNQPSASRANQSLENPAGKTAAFYAGLSHAKLRSAAFDLAAQLRALLTNWAAAQSQEALLREIETAHSHQDKERVWQEHLAASMPVSQELVSDYTARFKKDATLLKNELLHRLPSTPREPLLDAVYESAVNPVDIRRVMNDLGSLAEALLYR